MTAYYNEIDPYAAQWLRNLIAENLIAPGDVDERSIADVRPDDLAGYTQCHFFAGIGGWSLALRIAGWPDDRPVWTGSCPCQPFSGAGKRTRQQDERHLWPYWYGLIRERRPAAIFGEQVDDAVAAGWLDDVFHDLEAEAYACGTTVLPACSVTAPQERQRIIFVADANEEREFGRPVKEGCQAQEGQGEVEGQEWERLWLLPGGTGSDVRDVADAYGGHPHWWNGPLQMGWNCIEGEVTRGGRKHRAQWLIKPGLSLLAYGVPCRVGRVSAYGNAIVPQVAAEVIGAYLDVRASA